MYFYFKNYLFIIIYLLLVGLMGCVKNVVQVWVDDLDQKVRPESLKSKKK